MPKKCMKFPVQKGENSAKMPQLVAPVNALDEKTANTLFRNQEVILEHLIGFSTLVLSIKKDIRKIIEEEVTKHYGDKIKMVEAIYKRTIVIQNVWFDKKLITRKEIGDKYEEIKKKKEEK